MANLWPMRVCVDSGITAAIEPTFVGPLAVDVVSETRGEISSPIAPAGPPCSAPAQALAPHPTEARTPAGRVPPVESQP